MLNVMAVPLCAIAGCLGAVAGCHSWVPCATVAGCNGGMPMLGVMLVPLRVLVFGAAGCHCWSAIAGRDGWVPVPWFGAIAGGARVAECH